MLKEQLADSQGIRVNKNQIQVFLNDGNLGPFRYGAKQK